tara:strand:- start:35 stop:1105 length:1071 start_codon:yes stop_codon:yes gene_type:complete
MAYTTIDNPELFFQAKTYTGTGSSNAITLDGSENMQPDWVWIKHRNEGNWHNLYDSVRGVTKRLFSNNSNLEETQSAGLTAFGSDGFTVGSNVDVNKSSGSYVAWNWKAGTSFTNDASATGVGTIDSSGSTNQTAGFSIVSWTGTGSAGTIAHNLGSVPKWYLLKVRSGATNNWGVYHHRSNATNPEQYALYLDQNSSATDDSGLANDTAPTSTVFSVTSGNYGNQNGYNYIGYFFSEVKGYSKFGFYNGNANANGPYVHVGFKPAWIMVKATSATKSWYMWDNKRSSSGFNLVNDQLLADTADTEFDGSNIDILSNGFKFRSTGSGEQGNGTRYMYMAFAESPFANSNGVPNNAR